MEDKLTVCHCFNIRRAGNKVTAIYNQHISKSGLTSGQFSILSHLHYYAPINVSKLAELMSLERTTLVRNLKHLEQEGYICDEKKQGRSRQLILTQKGEEKQKQAKVFWQEAQQELEEKIGIENITQLRHLIQLIRNL